MKQMLRKSFLTIYVNLLRFFLTTRTLFEFLHIALDVAMQGARPKLSWSDGDNEGGGGERFHGCLECVKGGPPTVDGSEILHHL